MLFLLLKQHLDRLFIEFCVSLDHELLESEEVVHSHDLMDDLTMLRVTLRFPKGLQKLLLCNLNFSHQLA